MIGSYRSMIECKQAQPGPVTWHCVVSMANGSCQSVADHVETLHARESMMSAIHSWTILLLRRGSSQRLYLVAFWKPAIIRSHSP
jgi:hypothetical protein